jgi:SAM-dependent methyltransferase
MLQTVASAPPAPACEVCGGRDYEHTPVLWQQLAEDWELSPEEAGYIDVQQGTRCVACGCNVRSIAVAKALLVAKASQGPLASFVEGPRFRSLAILEINAAGSLSSYLNRAAGHRLVEYPEYDMMDLALPAQSFDLVVHSDTLEHVPDPLRALRECRRVLKTDGSLVFSVPVVIGRLGRSRAGMRPSYHGAPGSDDESLRVHTEFGADAWVTVLKAGFARVELVPFLFPSGLAMLAR